MAVFAEESTSWPGVTRPVHLGGLGFTYKWNMGWMHDMLDYTSGDPIHRKWHHNKITFSLMYAYSENFVLPFSHDEVVHGKRSMIDKMPGDVWQKPRDAARALRLHVRASRARSCCSWAARSGSGASGITTASSTGSCSAIRRTPGCSAGCAISTAVYAAEPALWQDDHDPRGFQWIDCTDVEHSVVSLLRRGDDPDDTVVAVVNFTPVPRPAYRIGVPRAGTYRELLNSDAAVYGGSNIGNQGVVQTEPVPAHGFEQSLNLMVPPLGFLLLKPDAPPAAEPLPAEHDRARARQ